MSERKYTYEQIVKALECFYVGVGCKGCPFIDQGCFDCGNIPTEFSESVLALINRQKEDVDKLQEVNADLNESLRLAAEANKDLNAEIERLADRSHKCIYLSDEESMEYCVDGPCPHYKTEAKIRAEAIKEFAERLKDKARMPIGTLYGKMVYVEDIDNLVAEMTEGT